MPMQFTHGQTDVLSNWTDDPHIEMLPLISIRGTSIKLMTVSTSPTNRA